VTSIAAAHYRRKSDLLFARFIVIGFVNCFQNISSSCIEYARACYLCLMMCAATPIGKWFTHVGLYLFTKQYKLV